ncbi:MAG: Metal transporter, ZIP family, partial [uncultured Rubrobacteraceae bacterium]
EYSLRHPGPTPAALGYGVRGRGDALRRHLRGYRWVRSDDVSRHHSRL